jgi:hypothetical protein
LKTHGEQCVFSGTLVNNILQLCNQIKPFFLLKNHCSSFFSKTRTSCSRFRSRTHRWTQMKNPSSNLVFSLQFWIVRLVFWIVFTSFFFLNCFVFLALSFWNFVWFFKYSGIRIWHRILCNFRLFCSFLNC